MQLFTITLVLLVLFKLPLPSLSLKRVNVRKLGKNYEARITAFSECEGVHPRDTPRIQLSRIDTKTVVIKYGGELHKPFDDSYTGKVDVSIWGNGGWRPNFYIYESSQPCSIMGKNTVFLANNNMSSIKCPVPAGRYKGQFKNYFTEFPMLPSAIYGTYLAKVELFDSNGTLTFCRYIESVFEQNFKVEN